MWWGFSLSLCGFPLGPRGPKLKTSSWRFYIAFSPLYIFLISIIYILYIYITFLFFLSHLLLSCFTSRGREEAGFRSFFLERKEKRCVDVCVCVLFPNHTPEKREREKESESNSGRKWIYQHTHTHTTLPTSLDLKYLVSLSLSETPCMYIYLRIVTPTSIHIYKL